jgi:hypothetical protein
MGSRIDSGFELAALISRLRRRFLHAQRKKRGDLELGAKMKIAISMLVLAGIFAAPSGQENPSGTHVTAVPVGLEVAQPEPAFALPDQFGHEQSNETLKGTNGTVLLFFRSADW